MARATHQSVQRYPLTAILGTDTGVRLLRELALHGGQLAAPDLVRRTGLAKASVARGLDTLERACIVRAVGTGRSVLYSLRPEHPLRPALSVVFEAERARFEAMLAGATDAAKSAGPGLVALWLFGSVARGEDRDSSDLDLALVAEPGSTSRLADAFRDKVAAVAGQAGFSPSVVTLGTGDVVRLSSERDPWWLHLVCDAISLIGERPEDLAARLTRAGADLVEG